MTGTSTPSSSSTPTTTSTAPVSFDPSGFGSFSTCTTSSFGFGNSKATSSPSVGSSSSGLFGSSSLTSFDSGAALSAASYASSSGQSQTASSSSASSTIGSSAIQSVSSSVPDLFGASSTSSPAFWRTPFAFPLATSASTPTASSLGLPTSTSTTAATTRTSSDAQSSATVVAYSMGTISTATAGLAATPKLPSEITGKTVEEIIKEWKTELQERTKKFQKQANAIAEWDRRILQNRDILARLEAEVAKQVETQAFLEQLLELIETHQGEIEKALQSVEEEAKQIYKDEHGLLPDDEAASTRDAMLEQAEFIERDLQQIKEQIKGIFDTLNTSQGGELEATDTMNPLDAAVCILNNQLRTLMSINEKAEEFSLRIHASQGSADDRENHGPKF
ncbi:hypothetical protein ACH5RR_023809 [Cinchona calisaya]|uniref:Nucleoporin NSP1-like C-terminal domain-containing protein n=1 Tax=Cinchona calisaya TaxID=153742 RepID=A0ABD2ZEU6_9GENT